MPPQRLRIPLHRLRLRLQQVRRRRLPRLDVDPRERDGDGDGGGGDRDGGERREVQRGRGEEERVGDVARPGRERGEPVCGRRGVRSAGGVAVVWCCARGVGCAAGAGEEAVRGVLLERAGDVRRRMCLGAGRAGGLGDAAVLDVSAVRASWGVRGDTLPRNRPGLRRRGLRRRPSLRADAWRGRRKDPRWWDDVELGGRLSDAEEGVRVRKVGRHGVVWTKPRDQCWMGC